MEDPRRRPCRPRRRGTRIPGDHHPGLRTVPLRRGLRHPGRRHAGRQAPALGRGGLPGPAGLAARGAGHQPRRIRLGPARRRQVHPRQTADHRSGGDRYPGPCARGHQAGLQHAGRASRRAGDPHRPRPGPDQPAGWRGAGRCAAADERPGCRGAAVGGPFPAAVAADGLVHAHPRRPPQQRRGGDPRPRDRPAGRAAPAGLAADRHRRADGDRAGS